MLDDKLDKIMFMMSKLTAQESSRIDNLKQRFTKVKEEDKLEIIMIKLDIKIDIDQIVEVGECPIEVELSMDKL